jgi:heme exporter protein C
MEIAARREAAGLPWWKILLAPWMLAVIVGAFVFVGPAQRFQVPEAARIVFFHVPVAMLLMVWFLVAAVYGILFLRRGALALDRRAAAAAEIGLLCTLLATVSGSIFARVQWRTWWNWDPKQIAIILVMFVYFAYFALRAEVDDEDRRARLSAVYALLAGVATPFLIWLIPQLPVFNSLHPGGVITGGQMSSDYRLVFWASVAGFFGITLWIYQLRLRLAEAAARAAERDD